MNLPLSSNIAPGRDQIVTSSALVRQFGVWQERAAHAPVYVLHRGRPRFVLTSVELMDALCTPHDGADESQRIDAVIDALPEIILLADSSLRVTASSSAARAYFGATAEVGAMLDAIGAGETHHFLAAAARRVADTGLAERLDLPSIVHPARILSIMLLPQPAGLAAVVRDWTLVEELRTMEALAAAHATAISAASGLAEARINLRGYLDAPGAALAEITGLSHEALAAVRFVSLIEITHRVAVAEAVEAVIAGGGSRGLSATLLINRAAPLPVRIGLAAIRPGHAVEAVHAIVVKAS